MNKSVIIIVFAFGILQGCFIEPDSFLIEARDTTIKSDCYPEAPEEVVEVFCNLLLFATDSSDPTGSNILAYEMLSSEAKSKLSGVKAGHSCRLLLFTEAQTLPGEGFRLKGITELTEQEARIEVYWKFGQDQQIKLPVIKTFMLVKEQNRWKIKEII